MSFGYSGVFINSEIIRNEFDKAFMNAAVMGFIYENRIPDTKASFLFSSDYFILPGMALNVGNNNFCMFKMGMTATLKKNALIIRYNQCIFKDLQNNLFLLRRIILIS